MAYSADSLKAYRSTAVQTASSGKLILMLFDGALRFLEVARLGMQEPPENLKRNEVIHNNITKVINIFLELQNSLNMEQGGDFSKTLYSLYAYMIERLHKANFDKSIDYLMEVNSLLLPIRDAWSTMLSSPNQQNIAS